MHTCECGVNTSLTVCWRCWQTQNDVLPKPSKRNELTQAIRTKDRSK